eukprot:symbB.v1.2.036608.t1/scaffold5206.1/size29832/3
MEVSKLGISKLPGGPYFQGAIAVNFRRAGREVTEVTEVEVVPAVPAAKAVARTPQKQPERRAEDEFREARSRPRPDPRAALESLAVPQADPPQEDPTQSSRVAPGERTEWTERHRDPPSDEFDRLDIISRRPLGSFRRAAPGASRRSVTGAELSRELFGANDTSGELRERVDSWGLGCFVWLEPRGVEV